MAEFVQKEGHPFSDDTREKVGVIVYDKGGKILLVEGRGGKLSLPKGGRLRGETELEGALREAWEETRIDLENIEYVEKVKLVWGVYFIYKLGVNGKELPLMPQPGEVVKILWKKPRSYWLKNIAKLNCDLRYYIYKQAHVGS
jgi:8-oxo-dGTP pyrophosphatase MutT (NUDIX family)